MIERLLAGDRALEAGDLDGAARLFDQVAEADPRNAIAVVGQARVALRRGDPDEARRLAEAALGIDPDEAAARALLADIAPAEEPAVVPVAVPVAAPTTRPSRGGLLGWLRRLFGR
jgi:thioredoxin-like negative regulator of GroEL